MWLRLTERAKKAVALAQDDARLSPDLLVLACLQEKGGIVARVLVEMDIDAEDLREKLEAITPDPGQENDELIELAEAEARSTNSPYIGSEHLLLGIIREGKCASAKVFTEAGVGYEPLLAALESARTKKQ